MAAAVYTVRTTLNPGVPYDVSQAEYEQLTDLGLVSSLDGVSVPPDEVLILPGVTPPPSPAVGQVWFNETIAP